MNTGQLMISMILGFVLYLMVDPFVDPFVDTLAHDAITAIQSNGCTNSQIEPSVNKERRETYKIKGGLYD